MVLLFEMDSIYLEIMQDLLSQQSHNFSEASANPNATVIGKDRFEDSQIRKLSVALKQQMLKEIREG
jgi:hypothetical protein